MQHSVWYRQFVEECREIILEGWVSRVEETFPGQYRLDELRINGQAYIRLLIDFNTPIENHPDFHIIPRMCAYHAALSTPFEHLVHSTHLWRKSLVTVIWDYLIRESVAAQEADPVISELHERIDSVQRYVVRYYCEYTETRLKHQEDTIHRLHEDRLSVLGKMAASMAHELRNPLFAIEGFLQLIGAELRQEQGVGGKVLTYLDVIHLEFKALYRRITDFLHFAKDGGVEEPFVQCGMKEIVQSVYALVGPRLASERIELELDLPTDFPLVVQQTGLQQVLSNLISNSMDALDSVSYPKKIGIRNYDDNKYYYMDVMDNGIGIPPHMGNTIFTPFITNKAKGTGLGLAICKQIMQKNRGDITYRSRPGETIFTLSLLKNGELQASDPQ